MRLPWSAWLLSPALLAVACYGVPYNEYILAPASRHLVPLEVLEVNGSVTNPSSLTQSSGGNATFDGPASVTFDFGRNIAGIVSLDIGSSSTRNGFIGVTFTESSLWISSQACDATADSGLDSPLWFPVGQGPGTYTAEKKHNRGAFRYMTLVTNTTAAISVRNVQINYTAAPSQDLRAYTGYFHSNDELLNRVWYAGAYTNQICTIDPSTGNALPFLGIISSDSNITLPDTTPWYSNYTISNGSSTLTDGAKRDRLIWPGDMSIALESVSVSTSDLYSVRTALETLLSQQKPDGRLPYASKPFIDIVSFTYHLHSLVGVSYYYRHSGDRAWLSQYWGQYQKGLQWALSSVDDTGLANVTASSDWLRFGMGGHNIEANAILYFVLNEAQDLSQAISNHTNANWTKIASGIKSAANRNLWDASNGLYKDNETTTLHPQDGNAWAIKANLTLSANQSSTISSALSSRWGKYGAPAPEAADAYPLSSAALNYRPTSSQTNPRKRSTLSAFSPAGATWRFAPQPGDLTSVDAGYTTALGLFSTTFKRSENGDYQGLTFTTPQGTTGDVDLAGVEGALVSTDGERISLVKGTATGIAGGSWELEVASQ
ncbi:putative alpha-L-rhamnosidase A [Aspergillus nomiae NRRL 13137]|uniref:Putative alpha-L-rhamnosidase A n=1 Tax=Aspergillus nomiae NRRL (strain ATCC 15546 / NRRL 13137 / CBS 260.88 / M93) TaxID=1509407 RepID=A0A0L1J292_ASPN3|nr:putative alpha-L-rhamnosidase A [Aspergillus nomiae NRRL 13137]KNG85795.1 putative alpha-L-rhamnosidase A [Aspergillus nomiae NRRL 13137]